MILDSRLLFWATLCVVGRHRWMKIRSFDSETPFPICCKYIYRVQNQPFKRSDALKVSRAAIFEICKLTLFHGPIYGVFFLELTMTC